MHSANLSRDTDLSKLAHLPGVSTIAYSSSGWTVSGTGKSESPAVLLTNVEDVAKSIHKRLHREQMNHGPDLYYEEEINPLLKAVLKGCKET